MERFSDEESRIRAAVLPVQCRDIESHLRELSTYYNGQLQIATNANDCWVTVDGCFKDLTTFLDDEYRLLMRVTGSDSAVVADHVEQFLTGNGDADPWNWIPEGPTHQELTIRVGFDLHSRPSERFARIVLRYRVHVLILNERFDFQWVDGRNLMNVISVAATVNTILKIRIYGEDAHLCAVALARYLSGTDEYAGVDDG